MVELEQLKGIVTRYLELHPRDASRIELLGEMLQKADDSNQVCLRSCRVGHVTASALVICPESNRILLVNKPAWKRHLQPGGHLLEEDDSPLSAAQRHLKWRLGDAFVDMLEYVQFDYDSLIPIDIDSHSVPASGADGEPRHKHFDFRYVFFIEDEDMLSQDTDFFRKHQPKWFDLQYLQALNSFNFVIPRIQQIGAQHVRRRRFFGDVIANCKGMEVSTIPVVHVIPDVPDYLRSLRQCTNVLGVLAKPKSIDDSTRSMLEDEGFSISVFTRNSAEQFDYLDEQIANSPGAVVLLDIGGCFSKQIEPLAKKHGNKLIGVVEDTENGLQKYLDASPWPVPVFSAARSPLKEHEDFLIGQSIVFSTDALLRDCGSLLQYANCSVIGYGKVGSSIAHHLIMRGISPNVFEEDPQRQLMAYNRNCQVQSWKRLLNCSDVLFSATGNQALELSDFRQLKNGCFVTSVTSSDDEFDFSFLRSEYQEEAVTENVVRLTGEHNYFHLLNDGNAPNFLHGAVVGDFIHLVRAEMLTCVSEIVELVADKGINGAAQSQPLSLSDFHRDRILKCWLRTFTDRRWPET